MGIDIEEEVGVAVGCTEGVELDAAIRDAGGAEGGMLEEVVVVEEADSVLSDVVCVAVLTAFVEKVRMFDVGGIGDVWGWFLEEYDSGVVFADGGEEAIKGIGFLYIPREDCDVRGGGGDICKGWGRRWSGGVLGRRVCSVWGV